MSMTSQLRTENSRMSSHIAGLKSIDGSQSDTRVRSPTVRHAISVSGQLSLAKLEKVTRSSALHLAWDRSWCRLARLHRESRKLARQRYHCDTYAASVLDIVRPAHHRMRFRAASYSPRRL